MQANPIQRAVIVGGGTAGWMTAALLARAMGPRLAITLVESDEIGTVGVGEATIPQIRHVNAFLGIDEDELMRAVKGTFKLAIQFNDWRRIGDSYLHAFGDIGLPLGLAPFHHYWLRDRHERGEAAPGLWAYSINAAACAQNRFARMDRLGSSPMTGPRHAYHLDAGLYGQYLRKRCDPGQVQRVEGKVVEVRLRQDNGFIESLQLADGRVIEGDLFVDCSGFRGLLIEGALKAGYDDWTHWLPCDRAIAVPSARVAPMRPYTQASARAAGWQWRIPLQHRNGNGHVFCSRFISEDEATATLLANLDGEPLAEPRTLRFTTGARRRFWIRNCVALGLASGFMEPLESTSIHMIQSGINRLISLVPDKHCDPALSDEYNRQTRFEYERIRDFLVLHYRATERDDSAFWRHCAAIDIPPGLAERMELFRRSGQIVRQGEELFTEVGWLQVMLGQGVVPQAYLPVADALPVAELEGFLGNMRTLVQRAAATFPEHGQFIAAHCRAPD